MTIICVIMNKLKIEICLFHAKTRKEKEKEALDEKKNPHSRNKN